MPHNHEWQTRIKTVEREYQAIRQAADRFQEQAHRDPTILAGDVRFREATRASKNLEGTYLIRIFAEFESGLRSYWRCVRKTKPPAYQLLKRLAAIRLVPDATRDQAHEVQDYRNALVPEREDEPLRILVGEARGRLCRFFSFLPPQW